MQAEQRYILKRGTLKALRRVFEHSLEREEEFAGCFEQRPQQHENVIELGFEESSRGVEGDDWIGCQTKDAPYTWHTHPICYGGDGEAPTNHGSPVFVSGEDLVGLVQDDRRNHHFLSNPTGALFFDCILTVAGILVVGAKQEAIDLWGQLTHVDMENKSKWIDEYELGISKRTSLAKVKKSIEKNKQTAYAEVVAGYKFIAFEQHCGSYGYFGGKNDVSIFDRLLKACPFTGYHAWWPRDQLPEDERTEWDTSTPRNRMLAVKEVQLRWFRSETFLVTQVMMVYY
jgi:hypothetical protein